MTLMDGRIVREFVRDEQKHYRFVSHIPEDREEPEKVNPFVKAGNGLWEIGKDIKQGYEIRAENRHDSWYDYANYWSSGLLDVGKGMGEGLENRADKAFESPSFYNVTNWLSMGSLDLVNGAINPDDALSKEHLTANLGLVGLLGVVKGATPAAGGSNAVKSASQSAKTKKKTGEEKQEGKASEKSTSKTTNSQLKGNMFRPVLIPSVHNLVNNFKRNMPEVKVVEDSVGGYHFSVRKGEGGGKDNVNKGAFKKQLVTKPKNSPAPERWIKKGGEVTIDDNGTWIYTNKKGQSVSYPGGYPDFTNYMHPDVKPVEVDISKPTNRAADFREANKKAGLNKESDPPVDAMNEPPAGYTWHHHEDGKTMILVDKKVHREFTHVGGIHTVNGD